MTGEVTLVGISCEECGMYYFAKAESHESECPKCKNRNSIIVMDKEFTDEELKLFQDIFKDIQDVFKSYCISVSEVEIYNFVNLVCNKKL